MSQDRARVMSKRTFVYGAFLRLDDTNNYGIGVRHNF